MIGQTLSHYRITEKIGAGGMGEVYKAKDTRLDRTVAIKVLPSHLADNSDLKQRFEREARAVSSLNHPHICTLHDVGEENDTAFLVMEYIEGETLANRLKKGALPLDQALRHGIEIADALDKAHRQGVVHRDLKPGNIMLTKSGAKLLDFGLAKVKGAAPGQEASVLSALPTEEKPLTEKGSILGTFQYMAPEQLEGKDADARTDIFAFGSVLYEMVTGRKAFKGKSHASLIAAILEHEPTSMTELRPMSPHALERVVKMCLSKDPEDRWYTAHDLLAELRWIAKGDMQEGPGVVRGRRKWGPLAVAVLIGILLGVFLMGLAVWSFLPGPPPRPAARFAVVLPTTDRLTLRTRHHVMALSPDGKHLVYVANNRLYLRAMDQMEAIAIAGTEGNGQEFARSPFFSPDGQWVGFWSRGKLKKVSVSGGAPISLCDAPTIRGVSWGPDDTIVFGHTGGIMQVSAAGGTPEELVVLDSAKGEMGQFPQILPGGKAVLFTLGIAADLDKQIVVQTLESGERRVLIERGGDARYVHTGHLVYALSRTLYAVRFDPERLEVTGGPVPVAQGVARPIGGTGAAHFSFSETGSLVYAPEIRFSSENATLVWVDREGLARPGTEKRGAFNPRLSTDGRRLAVTMSGEEGRDIWLHEFARGTWSRLTFEGQNEKPLWSPDGKRIFFGSDRVDGVWQLFSKSADGSGEAEQLTQGAYRAATSISPDGKSLIFRQRGNDGSWDLGTLRLGSERDPEILLATPFDEHNGMISPDGRWLAYTSNESGRDEVYVRSYLGSGGKWPISTEGGTEPMWSPDGEELFYRNSEKMMVVVVSMEPDFTPGKPRLLFEGDYIAATDFGGPASNYDVKADGQQFLMVRRDQSAIVQQQVYFVFNWFEELKRLVPTEN